MHMISRLSVPSDDPRLFVAAVGPHNRDSRVVGIATQDQP
jgi:hypothetical protein